MKKLSFFRGVKDEHLFFKRFYDWLLSAKNNILK